MSPENLPWVTVWATAAMLPMVVVVRGLSSFVNVYLLSKIGLGVLETLRLKVYRKYQDLSLAFHDRQQKGDLLSRLMQDTQFLQGGLVQIANDLIIQPLTLLAALGFLIYRASVSQQFLILLANMLLVGVCVIPIRYIGKKMLAWCSPARGIFPPRFRKTFPPSGTSGPLNWKSSRQVCSGTGFTVTSRLPSVRSGGRAC